MISKDLRDWLPKFVDKDKDKNSKSFYYPFFRAINYQGNEFYWSIWHEILEDMVTQITLFFIRTSKLELPHKIKNICKLS